MKHFIVFFLALTISPFLSQELNCKVSIIKEASLEVNSTELEIFKELELVLTELMNNTQWTKDQFKTDKGRQYSIILYLNDSWQIADDGMLSLYPEGKPKENISPNRT